MYPYYPPYYAPPAPHANYYSKGNNSTPSSTSMASMTVLGLSETDINPSVDEIDVEEVVAGVAIIQEGGVSKRINC